MENNMKTQHKIQSTNTPVPMPDTTTPVPTNINISAMPNVPQIQVQRGYGYFTHATDKNFSLHIAMYEVTENDDKTYKLPNYVGLGGLENKFTCEKKG
jgi:hypothetical protein